MEDEEEHWVLTRASRISAVLPKKGNSLEQKQKGGATTLAQLWWLPQRWLEMGSIKLSNYSPKQSTRPKEKAR